MSNNQGSTVKKSDKVKLRKTTNSENNSSCDRNSSQMRNDIGENDNQVQFHSDVKNEKFEIFTEDNMSMGLLLILYTLQGIPMGLCGSIPLILKERKVSYEGNYILRNYLW
jgi:PAT family acetyl-CoA transporter-like MFS transporter 1